MERSVSQEINQPLFFHDDFYGWLKKKGRAIWLSVSFILPALTYLAHKAFPTLGWIFQDSSNLEAVVQWIQTIAVLVVLFLIHSHQPLFNSDSNSLSTASKKAAAFYRDWLRLWRAYFLFYATLGIKSLFHLHGPSVLDPYWFVALTFLINMTTINIFFCYLGLAEPTGKLALNSNLTEEQGELALHTKRSIAWIVLLVMTLANILCSLPFISYQWPKLAYMLISGLAAGVALALLVGRFESKYIHTPQIILIFLYIYAVTQTTYGFFDTNLFGDKRPVNIRPYMSMITLPLKLVLFAFVSWLLKEGRLLFYFVNISDFSKDVNKRWKLFKARASSAG
jgi:hypothetical protein